MKHFDVDSFGSNCPDNWEEIADYLNSRVEAGEDAGQVWETYCSGGYQDAPEAEERGNMKKYKIIYDTDREVNKEFIIDAIDTQSAWDAFYFEVESEETVEHGIIVEM